MIICDTGPLVAVLNANDKDHQRCTELLEAYPGPILVPIALAERLDVRQIATLDRRDFTVVRPRHVDVLTLLPG